MTGPLDHSFLESALLERFPLLAQDVIRYFSSFDTAARSVIVVDAESALYFAHQHPRAPGSSDLGLLPTDPIRIFPDALEPEVLKEEIAAFRPKELIADFRSTAEVSLAERSEQIEACCAALELFDIDKEDRAFLLALVDSTFLTAPETQGGRDALLQLGDLAELFDCDDCWYMEWVRGTPGAHTQMTAVPAAVRSEMFRGDLEDWDLSRWGRAVKLPLGRPWKWSELPSAAPMLVQRSVRDLTELDPRLPSEAAAYMRLVAIETALFYVLQLCLGEGKESWWKFLDKRTKDRLSGQLALTDDVDELQLGLNFTDFREIIRSSHTWERFSVVVDPKGALGRNNVFQGFESLVDVRNRVMHPIRLLARPIRPRDLQLLDEWLVEVREMAARAEAIHGDRPGHDLG